MKKRTSFIFSVIYYILYFLYILLLINPKLIFHYQQLGFSYSKYFLFEYLSYPGGIAEYLSLFLFQFNQFLIIGAIIFTGYIYLINTITGQIIINNENTTYYLFKYLPGILIAGLQANYSFHLVFIITILFLLSLFYIQIILFKKHTNSIFHIISIPIIYCIIYYLLGGLAFLIFSLSHIIYLIFEKKKKSIIHILIILFISALIPYASSKLIFLINFKDAYIKFIPYYFYYKPNLLIYCFYFYLPVALIISKIVQFIQIHKWGISRQNKLFIGQIIQYVLIIVSFLAIVYFTFDKNQKLKILVDYNSYNGNWEKVIDLTIKNQLEDRLIVFHFNRALYNTGKLNQNMFDIPQIWGIDGLFLGRFMVRETLLPTTLLCIDLGHINEAIHWGNEAISQIENSPQIIEQLIISNIIADKFQSAKLYINELKYYPFQRKKAIKFEKYLNNISISEINSLVKEKREIMPTVDFIVDRQTPQYDLIRILENKNNNKMAFEYLMAYCLLNNDLVTFMKYFHYGKNFHYQSIPKIYEEALIIYLYELQKSGKTLENIKISKEILNDFNEYLSVLQKNKGDKTNAHDELEEKFGNTYWYYIHYISPVTTNKKITIK
ncbi:MAG: hypothetical protein JXB17_02345 [Bacteroidales bacterium]|nr:hypothetical protein [Bacteroidales bacterium]